MTTSYSGVWMEGLGSEYLVDHFEEYLAGFWSSKLFWVLCENVQDIAITLASSNGIINHLLKARGSLRNVKIISQHNLNFTR
jgi:hypothetical protein